MEEKPEAPFAPLDDLTQKKRCVVQKPILSIILLITLLAVTAIFHHSKLVTFTQGVKQTELQFKKLERYPFIQKISLASDAEKQIKYTVTYDKNWHLWDKKTPAWVDNLGTALYQVKADQLSVTTEITNRYPFLLKYNHTLLPPPFFDGEFQLLLPNNLTITGKNYLHQDGRFGFISDNPIKNVQGNEQLLLKQVTLSGTLPLRENQPEGAIATDLNLLVDGYQLEVDQGAFKSETAIAQIDLKSSIVLLSDNGLKDLSANVFAKTDLKTGNLNLTLKDLEIKGRSTLSQVKLKEASLDLVVDKVLYGWLPMGTAKLSLDKLSNMLFSFDKLNLVWRLVEDSTSPLFNSSVHLVLQASQLTAYYNRYSPFLQLPNTQIKFKRLTVDQQMVGISKSVLDRINQFYQESDGFTKTLPPAVKQNLTQGIIDALMDTRSVHHAPADAPTYHLSSVLLTDKGTLTIELYTWFNFSQVVERRIEQPVPLLAQLDHWYHSLMNSPMPVSFDMDIEVSAYLYEQLKQEFSALAWGKLLFSQLDQYLLKDTDKLTYHLNVSYHQGHVSWNDSAKP